MQFYLAFSDLWQSNGLYVVIVFYDYTVMITIGIAQPITDKDLFNPLWIITLYFYWIYGVCTEM